MISEAPITIAVSGGVVLAGRVMVPSGARTGVVLCHPHPLYGGDMENPVVVRAAEVCREAGLATLRFDFRGVGASTGAFDEGRGEQDDLLAAFDHLLGRLPPHADVAVAGYSFGAAIAGQAAMRRPVAGVALIAPALAMAALANFEALATFARPLLVVAGTADRYCPLEALERLAAALPKATIRTVDGADHFFLGKLFPLGEIVRAWAQTVVAGTG